MSDNTLRPGEARVRMAFKCTECGAGFHGADDLIQHYRDNHPDTEQVDTEPVAINLTRPLYEGRILTHNAGDQILWMERITHLEKQVAELKSRLDTLEGGK